MNSTYTLIKSVGECVYETLLVIDTHHPDWFQRKYQSYPWTSAEFKVKLITKLGEKLGEAKDRDSLMIRLIAFLINFLLPDFFASNYFSQLLNKIRYLEADGSHKLINQNEDNFSYLHEAFSVLLLDAENLSFTENIEKFLEAIATYPIKIKLAVANWRNLGKRDEELTSRGYELFHVPSGKNSADFKLLSLGSSLFINYPLIQEVFVCSSDGDLEHLSNFLSQQGILVNRVYREKNQIIITNSKTDKIHQYPLDPDLIVPSLEDFIVKTKDLIIQEQKKTQKTWILLSKIATLIKQEFKLNISQITTHHFPNQKAKDIFLELKDHFVLHQSSVNSQVYITVFAESVPLAEGKTKTAIQKLTPEQELQQKIVTIIKNLSIQKQQEYIPITDIASQFNKQYQTPITKAIKSVTTGSNFPKFLKACQQFNLKQDNNVYYVGVKG